ncbi:MAG TPA: VOC family protein [Allosphingosinicella sp.]|jgi:catechol 2,3-dioxygenase-like lactoylglutathione lyase family enzyme
MKVKGLSWVGVGTDDYGRALRFFTEVLGLEVAVSGDRQAILHVGEGGQQLEIFGRDGPGKALNTPPTVAFEVEDVAAARDELIAAGVELIGEVGRWNGFEWQYFRSPDGHVFEVKKSPPPGWEKEG